MLSGAGDDLLVISQLGQNVFHSGHVLVSLMRLRTSKGEAGTRDLAITENRPFEPYVGTGIGSSREDVMGLAAEVVGSDIGG
jgi:hypothetical protein